MSFSFPVKKPDHPKGLDDRCILEKWTVFVFFDYSLLELNFLSKRTTEITVKTSHERFNNFGLRVRCPKRRRVDKWPGRVASGLTVRGFFPEFLFFRLSEVFIFEKRFCFDTNVSYRFREIRKRKTIFENVDTSNPSTFGDFFFFFFGTPLL